MHWHGIELESYFDGVPGWGGDSKRVTPPIKPGETFVAEMAPPRAGTFMYHTRWHDAVQLASGMYGPLIVLPPGEKYDPTTERMVRLASGDQPIEWRNIAKDGADLPPQQIVNTKEALSVAVGETRDFEFRPTAPGDLRVEMEIRLPNGNLRTAIGIHVQ